MNLVASVRQAGVVGAGGAGFPTHLKIAGAAEVVVANGAECEPLVHKDAAIMEHEAEEVVRGLLLVARAVKAPAAVVGVKMKNARALGAMEAACRGTTIRVHPLGDYYPAGDEYDLVYETTRRLVPPSGIPLNVGVVVCNVETLANVARAAAGLPVTHKLVTIAGAVRQPVTLRVPIGTSVRECVAAAGGPVAPDPLICLGGVMMGETTEDWDHPVTKTTAAIIALPRAHRVAQRKLTGRAAQNAIGRSACDQCRYCTEYCPRFLLGYPVEPHQVMRSLAFGDPANAPWNSWAALCCSCGLCTWYACPELLFPKEACDQAKAAMRRAGFLWQGPTAVKPHPMREGRRVPAAALARKLGLADFESSAPLQSVALKPRRLVLRLRQGSGHPVRPSVKIGDSVVAGQLLGDVHENEVGAALHAPVAGRVAQLTADHLVLDSN